MFEIKINDTTLELPADMPVGLQLINPYLQYDSIVGSTGNLPKIPWTLKNQRIFGYFEMPQIVQEALVKYQCEQYYNGHRIRQGSFVLTEASLSDGYAGAFVENVGEFFGDYQTKLLTEIDFGTVRFDSTSKMAYSTGGNLTAVFPEIINPDYYGTTPGSYSGKMNDFTLGADSPKVPMFFVKYIVQKIAEITGKKIEGTVFSHPALSNLLLYNTRDSASLINQTDYSIQVNRHLPELRVGEFFIELFRKIFNQTLEFNLGDNALSIGSWEDELTKPAVKDWSGKATTSLVKIAEQNPRFELSYVLDGGDALMKDKPATMLEYTATGTVGGLYQIQSKFSTLLTDEIGLAMTKQVGVTERNAQLANKFAPRLLFWNGLMNGVQTATANLGNYSLYWNGEDGLANRFWRQTILNRLEQFYLRQGIIMNETDIATLNFQEKIHLNGVNYLVVQAAPILPLENEVACLLVKA